MTLPVTVGELPPRRPRMASLTGDSESTAPANALGVVVDDLTADQRKQLGLDSQRRRASSRASTAPPRAAPRSRPAT